MFAGWTVSESVSVPPYLENSVLTLTQDVRKFVAA